MVPLSKCLRIKIYILHKTIIMTNTWKKMIPFNEQILTTICASKNDLLGADCPKYTEVEDSVIALINPVALTTVPLI